MPPHLLLNDQELASALRARLVVGPVLPPLRATCLCGRQQVFVAVAVAGFRLGVLAATFVVPVETEPTGPSVPPSPGTQLQGTTR